jgi:hypothetical protein
MYIEGSREHTCTALSLALVRSLPACSVSFPSGQLEVTLCRRLLPATLLIARSRFPLSRPDDEQDKKQPGSEETEGGRHAADATGLAGDAATTCVPMPGALKIGCSGRFLKHETRSKVPP